MLNDYMYRGVWRNLKRLRSMSAAQKVRYMARVVVGELLPARVFGIHALRLVEISLTDRCQCCCGHCFAATQDREDELAAADVERLLRDLARLGIVEICFSGGEPLLHPEIVPLVAHASEQGLLVRMISNGILLTEDMVVRLKRAGLQWCSVSLDGPTSAVHDAFRGYPGCFDRAVGGLRYLVHNNIPCSIVTVARRELIKSGGLHDLVKLGDEIGVSVVRINFPVPIGRFSDQEDQVLTLAERQEVRRLLRYGNTTMESPREGTTCKAGVTKVNILPNGDVTPCAFIPLPFGNIHQDRFADIWKAMMSHSSMFKTRGQCSACDPATRARIREFAAMHEDTLGHAARLHGPVLGVEGVAGACPRLHPISSVPGRIDRQCSVDQRAT